jgi:hypothetical protein
MYRIIGANQVEYGPITADQLRQWIAEGRADANTRVKLEGTEDWRVLSSFPEFSATLTPVPGFPGTIAPNVSYSSQRPRTNPMALTGMIMGILSILVGWICCSGPVFSILGITFSAIGISQINKNPGGETGKGMAITGLVLSILGILFFVVIFALFGLIGALGDSIKN